MDLESNNSKATASTDLNMRERNEWEVVRNGERDMVRWGVGECKHVSPFLSGWIILDGQD